MPDVACGEEYYEKTYLWCSLLSLKKSMCSDAVKPEIMEALKENAIIPPLLFAVRTYILPALFRLLH
jgi:hypothetical protein